MNYKELVVKAKERGIVYAWRSNGKTVWKAKEKLEQELGITSDTSSNTGASSNTSSAEPTKTSAHSIEEAILSLIREHKASANIPKDLENRLTALENKRESYRGVEVKDPSNTHKVEGLTHKMFDHVLRLASQRINIMLVGPAGTGKTHLASQVAEGLGLPFAFISASAGMSESALEGHLLPVGDSGRFEYCASQFVNFYENGGVYLIDEIDSGDANLLTIVNSALANGHMSINKRFNSPIAKRHKDFICITCANTFGNGANRTYAGRQQLDGATLDRFRAGIVYIDYDERIEEKLVEPSLLSWGRNVRAKINTHGLRRIMSTRFLRDYSKLISTYPKAYNLETAKETYFSDWSVDEKAKVA